PKRGFRAQARAYAAVGSPGDRLVQSQRAAPKILVAERIETKRVTPVGDLLRRVLPDIRVVRCRPFVGVRASKCHGNHERRERAESARQGEHGRPSFRGRSLTSDPCEYRSDDRVAMLPAERERVARGGVELALQKLLQHVASTVKTRLNSGGLYAEQLGGLGDAQLLDAAQHEDLTKLLGQPIDGGLQYPQQ